MQASYRILSNYRTVHLLFFNLENREVKYPPN